MVSSYLAITFCCVCVCVFSYRVKGKVIPLQARCGSEGR